MNQRMKLLLADDGSICTDNALKELHHVGLPAETEVMIFSVAESVPCLEAMGADRWEFSAEVAEFDPAHRLAQAHIMPGSVLTAAVAQASWSVEIVRSA